MLEDIFNMLTILVTKETQHRKFKDIMKISTTKTNMETKKNQKKVYQVVYQVHIAEKFRLNKMQNTENT